MRSVEEALRLLPTERLLWFGRPTAGLARAGGWRWLPALLVALGGISLSFAALLASSELPGAYQSALTACCFLLTAAAVWLGPSFILDTCEFAVTDRRVIWKRGKLRRSMDRRALTYARIRWHAHRPVTGTLELLRDVPFGPLSRTQRIVFHDLEAPDEVLALIRGVAPGAHLGDHTIPLADRLDAGEQLLWVATPEGPGVGWRDIATSMLGVFVLLVGLPAGLRSAAVLAELESHGLPTLSAGWFALLIATCLTAAVLLAVGLSLSWYGVFRARAMRGDTLYALTDRRLLIRRGRTELSLDRRRIVDVAATRAWRGLTNLHLVLDGPDARALADSGALGGSWQTSRDAVPPVLFELSDPGALSSLLMGPESRPSLA